MGWELLGVLGWVGGFFVSKSYEDELTVTYIIAHNVNFAFYC